MTDTPSNYGFATSGKIAKVCLRCGVAVADTDVHDGFHDGLYDWLSKMAESAHIHVPEDAEGVDKATPEQ